jgi:intracellular septation protein
MKLLYDFFPIILFFIAYKMYGIYVATAVAMIAGVVQVAGGWFKNRRVEKMHLVSLGLLLVFGGATLLLQDPLFIKWKPTIVNWLFAAVFLGSQFIGEKPLIERMMSSVLKAPPTIWQRLNLAWVLFFIASGVANIYVAYHFSEETWVNFKLFGLMGMTFVFIIGQGVYLARYAEPVPEEQDPEPAVQEPENRA